MMGPTDLLEPVLQGQNEAQAEKIVLRSYPHRTGQLKFFSPYANVRFTPKSRH
jgi:hypothetical protein